MIQAFERRVLTYVPTNVPGFQVEMGNIGLHYYDWRYKDAGKPTVTPSVNATSTPPAPARPARRTPSGSATTTPPGGTSTTTPPPTVTGTPPTSTATATPTVNVVTDGVIVFTSKRSGNWTSGG